MHRTQILLEPQQYRRLGERARRQRQSLSAVIRTIIQQHLDREEREASGESERRAEVVHQIQRLRESILENRGGRPLEISAAEVLNEMREGRDAEIAAEPAGH